jgi:hypothetical protein
MNISRVELEKQFAHVKQIGWLPFFLDAAQKYDLPEAVFVRRGCSRETARNEKGDYENGRPYGFGVLQVDRRYYPARVAAGRWRDPKEAIRMRAFVLRSSLDARAARGVPEKDRLRVALSAYKCWAARSISRLQNGRFRSS